MNGTLWREPTPCNNRVLLATLGMDKAFKLLARAYGYAEYALMSFSLAFKYLEARINCVFAE
ncbi:hypothetical protein Micr_00582 [Candidatus Micrarchaeum sp.]|jgi:hypothetical protein|nr:hypothetical protein Micr_00582 [Candidatus Micrarchaeum sp.]